MLAMFGGYTVLLSATLAFIVHVMEDMHKLSTHLATAIYFGCCTISAIICGIGAAYETHVHHDTHSIWACGLFAALWTIVGLTQRSDATSIGNDA
jgi:hypothetical protein